jgi:plastocyanin
MLAWRMACARHDDAPTPALTAMEPMEKPAMSTSRRPTKRPPTQANQAKPHPQPGTRPQTTARQTSARPATTQRPAPHNQTHAQARGQTGQTGQTGQAGQAQKRIGGTTAAPLPPITRASRARRRWWREPRARAGIIAAALVVAGLVALLAHQQASSAPGGAGSSTTARGTAPTATAHAAASPAATAKTTAKATTKAIAGSTGSPCGSTVAMDDDSFFFRSCTIKRGATLTFQNQSTTETHVLCSGFFQVCHPALDAPAELNDAAPVVMSPGARHSFTFTHAGVFNITCLAHGGMDITVTVTD